MRGPLQLLKEKWLSKTPKVEHNVWDYVSSFRERLCKHVNWPVKIWHKANLK